MGSSDFLMSVSGYVFQFVIYLCVFCRELARGSRLLCLCTSAQGAAAAAGSGGSRRRALAERIVLQVGRGASSICSGSSCCGGDDVFIVAIPLVFIDGVVLIDIVVSVSIVEGSNHVVLNVRSAVVATAVVMMKVVILLVVVVGVKVAALVAFVVLW